MSAKSAATRALRGVMPRIIKPVTDGTDPSANAWPGGSKTIACLWCNRPFASTGRQERMCQSCRRHAL